MRVLPSPARAPANNGVHTVRRNPNGGLGAEARESLEAALDAAKSDLKALLWIKNHKELWFAGKVRRKKRRQE